MELYAEAVVRSISSFLASPLAHFRWGCEKQACVSYPGQ